MLYASTVWKARPPPSPPITKISLPSTAEPNPPRAVGRGRTRSATSPHRSQRQIVDVIVLLMFVVFRPPVTQNFPPTTWAWKWSRAWGMFGNCVQVLFAGS